MKFEKRNPLLAIGLTAVALILFVALISIPMARTSTTSFCTSCHEMGRYKTELEASSHAVDKDKKEIGCSQCHIPNTVGPKYVAVKLISGIKDLWVHNFGDPENLDRRKLQITARRFIVDANCRACHEDLHKNTKGETLSEIGRLSHDAYLGKNGTTKNGCAGCHFNMAHLPDFDRRWRFNAEFAKKLPPAQE